MEKLNEYLQTLISARGSELSLEPNKIPRVVSDKGTTDASGAPLTGTQISMLIFPLIPPPVKAELPNKSEIEFVHDNALGTFNFSVKKTPTGFYVIVRPLTINAAAPVAAFLNETNQDDAFQMSYSSANISTADIKEPNYQREKSPEIEVVPISDPEFATRFTDTSNYEPPFRPQEFASSADDYVPLPQTESSFEILPQNFQTNQYAEIAESNQPQMPAPIAADLDSSASSAASVNSQMRERMDALFYKMAETGASDLHLSAMMPPLVRRDGKMLPLESGAQVLSPETTKELLTAIMPRANQEEFARRHDTDFAYEIENLARFRANIFLDRRGMGGVFRIIPAKILTAEELELSPAIMDLCDLSKGLVVVTGPTGSGKSTTLCAMIDSINRRREEHIITIEDPIEFTHENQKCLINQREIHNHTDSFKDALRAALREDPDILLVGEMRDLETISIAIETAETGHLVFGTLHTTTAASTIDRIIDQFPADRQQQIRVMLSESLKGVIAQTLLPKIGGGRVAALEVLIVTPAISNLIREGKTFQIPSAMQTGKTHGMVMLNDALFELVKKGVVEPRGAYLKAVDKTNFEAMLERGGMKI